MQKMDCQAIGYGYIIIPKALLKEQLIDCSPHEGEIEAFLKLLIKVNYSETKLTDHQRAPSCAKEVKACTATAVGAPFSTGQRAEPTASYNN